MLVVALMFLAVVGNGFVLKFYGSNKKLKGQGYLLTLAVIDLVCCVVMLPQAPVFELYSAEDWFLFHVILALQGILQLVSYFGVQVTMALDQFLAVFWPFRHARLRRHLNRAMPLAQCWLYQWRPSF